MRKKIDWATALDILIGAFRSGLNMEEALELFFQESPEPLRTLLHRRGGGAWKWMSLEKKIETVFFEARVNLVKAALRLSLISGGRPGDLLESAAKQIRIQQEFEDRVKGLTAHARATAWIVGLSPVFLGVTIVVFAPEMVAPLFSSEKGRWIILSSVALIILGLWSVQKMSRIRP